MNERLNIFYSEIFSVFDRYKFTLSIINLPITNDGITDSDCEFDRFWNKKAC